MEGTGPGEVLDDKGASATVNGLVDDREGCTRIGPSGAIEDEAIDHRVEALFENRREFALPPENERKIAGKVGEDGVAESAARDASEGESDLFAADGFFSLAEVAVGGDPSAQGGLGGTAIHLDEEGAAGVLAGEFADDVRIFGERAFFFRIDGEVDEAGIGASFIHGPELAQFGIDASDGHFLAEYGIDVGLAGGGNGGCEGGGWRIAAHDDVRLESAPGVSIFMEEVIGFLGSPGASNVFGHGQGTRGLVPCLLDAIDEFPCFFDFIATGEKGGITGDGIEEESLVGLGAGLAEAGAVLEVHLDGLKAQAGAGDFRDHAQGNAFIGLDADGEHIAAGNTCGQGIEKHAGRRLEVHGDLGGFFRELLADANVERNSAPAPGIDHDAQGDVGFGHRFGIDAVFFAIAGHGFTADAAFGVLGADDVLGYFFGSVPLAHRADDFDFFIAHAIGTEVGGWLHCYEAEELKEVILHHVTERAGFIVVTTAAAFHAEIFGTGDLDLFDVAAVPERFKNGISKTQDHEVLRGFFAEVMIDAVGVFFLEGLIDHAVKALGSREIGAERFLDDDAGPATFFGFVESGVFELGENVVKKLGRAGDVEKSIALAAAIAIDGIECCCEAGVAIGIGELALVVVNVRRDAAPDGVIMTRARYFAVELFEASTELGIGFFATGKADDFHAWRQLAIECEVVERRHQLAVSEVACGAKNHNGARLRAGA